MSTEENKKIYNTDTNTAGVVYGNVGVGETTYEMNKFH